MTKEELGTYEIAPLSKIIPYWDNLSTLAKAVMESSFNLEWWRGYHAPRPATMQHVRMGQPAPEGDTHIILGAEDYERWRLRWKHDRDDQDAALRDAIREIAACADELAFWKYQAIFGRACLLEPHVMGWPFMEDSSVWKEAARQLDEARALENQERVAHAEVSRDPGAT